MTVEKGDKIWVDPGTIQSTPVTVSWSQNLSHRTQQYYSAPFTNQNKGNEQSIVFIQQSYLDSFKGKKTAGDDFTIIVDDSFQYGQNSDGSGRWLAYHDKGNKPKEWRFVATLKSKLGDGLAQFAGGLLKRFIGVDLGGIAAFFGDFLKDF